MKSIPILFCCLASLMGAASLSAAPKEQTKSLPLLVIPGEPGRPFTVIDNIAGIFEVTYKVTFTEGVGARVSFQEALGDAFDKVREIAKKNGADAVINTRFDYIPLPDGVIKDEDKLRGAHVIGLINVFGTQVKFTPPPAAGTGEKQP